MNRYVIFWSRSDASMMELWRSYCLLSGHTVTSTQPPRRRSRASKSKGGIRSENLIPAFLRAVLTDPDYLA